MEILSTLEDQVLRMLCGLGAVLNSVDLVGDSALHLLAAVRPPLVHLHAAVGHAMQPPLLDLSHQAWA